MIASKRFLQALAFGILFGLLSMLAVAAPSAEWQAQDKIDRRLLDEVSINSQANFWIGMAVEADLSAAYDMDWRSRGWYVYNSLVETARQTQASIVADLEAYGLEYESFWINNSVYVRGGNLGVIQALAARRDVARLKADDAYSLPVPPAEEASVQGIYDNWGLDWIHALEVWDLGYEGDGIVVANIDTGVLYTHEQLDDTYRGAVDGTHQYNWCDPSDICAGDAPCDNHGHGTHVMGTLSGENDDPVDLSPNLIGVAPQSTWIACKGCEGAECSDKALLECAEWVLAPTSFTSGDCGRPGPGDPDKRPHVVNNSWGDTASDPWYQSSVQAWRAAGIFPTFSAGNENQCNYLGSPGDYPEAFASANHQSNGVIHPLFSSRGPSDFGMAPYCKPNIAAPGTSIPSSWPSGGYAFLTGTSMASPHAAGTVALLWQACPDLVGQVDATFQTLQNAAGAPPTDPCAGTTGCDDIGCNCTYGYGYLDALAAVESCRGGLVGLGYLDGYVYVKDTSTPIEGVGVSAVPGLPSGGEWETMSSSTGHFTMAVPHGTYTVTAARTGLISETAFGVEVMIDRATGLDFYLEPNSRLDGHVYQLDISEPIEGATVAASSDLVLGGGARADTNAAGYYTMALLPGTYTVTATKNGYAPETVTTIEIVTDEVTSQDFHLEYLGGWVEVQPPDPHPADFNRFDGAFDPHDNHFYFPGGRTGTDSHDQSIWTYDPLHDLWVDTGCDMVYPAANYAVAYVEDDGTRRGEALYVVGGYDDDTGDNLNAVQRFYPSEPACVVEEVTTDPFPGTVAGYVVGAGGVAVVEGKIYYFGGWEAQSAPYFSDQTWQFDPQAPAGSRWEQISTAPLSPARSYINVAVRDGRIYAMGGIHEYALSTPPDLVPTDSVQVFDPQAPAAGWVTLSSLPVATAEGRGFAVQTDTVSLDQPAGKLYVAGGGDWPGLSAKVLEYDAVSDAWSPIFPSLNVARRDHAGAYASACTPDPTDGLPGMWVFGGRVSTLNDDPPYGIPEYYPLPCKAPLPPEAAFTMDSGGGAGLRSESFIGCTPLAVRFTDVSSGTVLERQWDFGDGTPPSSNWRPLHLYEPVGTYTVTLGVTNTSGSDAISDTVLVLESPQAAFTYSPTILYTDTVVHFGDVSTGQIVSRTWDLGDGHGDSVQNPVHTFVEPGSFTVTLTVMGDNGCPSTASQELFVRDSPFYYYVPWVIKNY